MNSRRLCFCFISIACSLLFLVFLVGCSAEGDKYALIDPSGEDTGTRVTMKISEDGVASGAVYVKAKENRETGFIRMPYKTKLKPSKYGGVRLHIECRQKPLQLIADNFREMHGSSATFNLVMSSGDVERRMLFNARHKNSNMRTRKIFKQNKGNLENFYFGYKSTSSNIKAGKISDGALMPVAKLPKEMLSRNNAFDGYKDYHPRFNKAMKGFDEWLTKCGSMFMFVVKDSKENPEIVETAMSQLAKSIENHTDADYGIYLDQSQGGNRKVIVQVSSRGFNPMKFVDVPLFEVMARKIFGKTDITFNEGALLFFDIQPTVKENTVKSKANNILKALELDTSLPVQHIVLKNKVKGLLIFVPSSYSDLIGKDYNLFGNYIKSKLNEKNNDTYRLQAYRFIGPRFTL